MKKPGRAAKILAITGTFLVLFPIVTPILFPLNEFLSNGFQVFEHFNFDFLMPAELFPVAFIGAILLTISSLISRSQRALIISGFCAAIGLLVGGQIFAVVTGLASGETEPTGWIWMFVIITLVIYTLSLIVMGVGGILLTRKLFSKT